jgi:hypothetical protein
MNTTRATLLGAAAWAIAFLVAALVFKGDRFGDWVDGALFVGFVIYLSSRGARDSRCQEKLRRRA